jgi:hypothetical protein
MSTCLRILAVLFAVAPLATAPIFAQQHPAMPPGMTHEDHMAAMERDAALKQRGAAAMGFDQDKTSHHFVLTASGGRIEVVVKDPLDDESRVQVRSHLKQIATDFANGSFEKPFATHGEMPPGARTMRRRRAAISYTYTDMVAGGRVTIVAPDSTSTAAVHAFLRYQIREHRTGDPLSIRP